MSHPPFGTALRHWLHRISEPAASHPTDAQLLERFIQQRDETAFAALVHRHGSLVFSVCHGILRDVHDAEDAFQATFLVLACRAAAIRRTASVASFLHGAASRIAQRLRVQKARHQARQQQAALQRSEISVSCHEDDETHALLHEELARLPRKYRDALVLCYLQGKTNEQAARELGCPPGSMSRHLSRARELLRDRLLGRGIGAALVISLLNEPARAAVSSSLIHGTLALVRRHALAAALLAGSTPPAAVMLAQGVLRAAWLGRAALVTAMLTVGIVLAGGMTVWETPTAKQPEAQPTLAAVQLKAPPRVDLYGDPLPEGALARMGTARLRHGQATQLLFSADGKSLISAGGDRTVRFWDVASGKLRRMQRLPPMQKVEALSADGKMLALSSTTQLHFWDIAAAKEIRHIDAGKLIEEKQLYAAEFSPDGNLLAGGNRDRTVLLWDIIRGKERARFKHPDTITWALAFSPDGKRLAAAGNQHLLLWDLSAGREIHTIEEQRLGYHPRLAFSPDGKLLGVALFDRAVLRDTATGKEEAVIQFNSAAKKQFYPDIAFSRDNKTVAIRVSEAVILWDRATKKEKKDWPIDLGPDSGRLRFSPDGKRLASLRAGKIDVWDVESGQALHDWASHSVTVDSVALSPDGKYLASSATRDYTVRLWHAHTGKPLHLWQTQQFKNYPLFFTPDGANLISVGLMGDSRMWAVRSGEEKRIFRIADDPKKPRGSITSASLSMDGKHLTAMCLLSETKNGAFRCPRYLATWDVASGKRIALRRLTLDRKILSITELLSPDGRYATVGDNRVLIFDTVADRPVRVLHDVFYGDSAFSPDSKLLAIGTGNYHYPAPHTDPVRVYDIASGDNLLTLKTGAVGGRAFSPDGRYLLTVEDDMVRFWELAAGKEVLRWQSGDYLNHFEMRYVPGNVAIATDGRSAAVGMSDGNAIIWDLAPATRQKRRLSAADLDRLWNDLAGEDAVRAYRAIGTLIADPQRAVPFLQKRLKPVQEDAPRIRHLVADLGSEQFPVRDAAWRELEKMDDAAHAVLRQELPNAKSLEQRRRIQALLKTSWVEKSPRKLRQIRAIAVLEQIGDVEARRLLKLLAEGSSEARQTREAKAALQRRTEPRP